MYRELATGLAEASWLANCISQPAKQNDVHAPSKMYAMSALAVSECAAAVFFEGPRQPFSECQGASAPPQCLTAGFIEPQLARASAVRATLAPEAARSATA